MTDVSYSDGQLSILVHIVYIKLGGVSDKLCIFLADEGL